MMVALRVCALMATVALAAAPAGAACKSAQTAREATSEEIASFVRERGMTVLTFVGYSGAGYEDPAAMLAHAAKALAGRAPAGTLVNIGATEVGIGAVYELAKKKGFTTMGIVSTLARDEQVPLSPCVDFVFYVRDASWGGRLPDSEALSPTSAAMVANSGEIVGIGGGEVGRDEMLAARAAGKPVSFFPADMNHALAVEKARKKGQPAPTDFRGAAHVLSNAPSTPAH